MDPSTDELTVDGTDNPIKLDVAAIDSNDVQYALVELSNLDHSQINDLQQMLDRVLSPPTEIHGWTDLVQISN